MVNFNPNTGYGYSIFSLGGESKLENSEQILQDLEQKKVEIGTLSLQDGSKYEGQLKNGQMHGWGKLTNFIGFTYEGEFIDGCLNEGKVTYLNGVIYEGKLTSSLGYYKYERELPNPQEIYEKEFEEGILQRWEKIKDSQPFLGYNTKKDREPSKALFFDGAIFEGIFTENLEFHSGKLTHADGTIYEGTFQNNRLHGPGKQISARGTIIEGTFIEDRVVDGDLTFIFPNKTMLRGKFKNGKFEEGRVAALIDGKEYVIELKNGCFKRELGAGNGIKVQNTPIYRGKLTYPDKTIYEGDFTCHNILANGWGKMTKPNGVVLEGQFIDGKLNFYGKMIYCESVSQGLFKDGYRHGPVKQTAVKKSILGCDTFVGRYENGNLMAGPGILIGNHKSEEMTISFKDGIPTFKLYTRFPGFYGFETMIVNESAVDKPEPEEKNEKALQTIALENSQKSIETPSEGKSKIGELNGWGQKLFPHGVVLKGRFQAGEILDGPANLTFNGWVINGTIKSGKFEGSKKITQPDGISFNYNDRQVIYADKTVYEGELTNFTPHGEGTMTYPDGMVYQGIFRDGNFHGRGKLTFADGETYEGDFEEGMYSGFGTLVYSKGGSYVGNFKDDLFHGKGIRTYSSGVVDEGEFAFGKLQGQGKRSFPNQSVYIGQFNQGKFHGQGQWTFPLSNVKSHGKIYNGNMIYEGGFKDGKFHGLGWLTSPAGNVYRKTYKDGKKVKVKKK